MGRIKIEKIENLASRQVTFSRRQKELFKKAKELSILCDVEVAVIVFFDTDEPYEFSSTSMERTLSRYGRRNIDLNEVQHRPNDQPQAQDVKIEATILQEKKVRRKLQARGKQVDEIDNTRKSELDNEIPDTLQLGLSSPVYQKKRSLRMRASNQ